MRVGLSISSRSGEKSKSREDLAPKLNTDAMGWKGVDIGSMPSSTQILGGFVFQTLRTTLIEHCDTLLQSSPPDQRPDHGVCIH